MNEPQLRYWRRRIFLVCWLTYAGYYLGRVNLSVALPALQGEFHWPKSDVGLIGTALYWSYALGQLLNGYLGERVSARRLVAAGLLLSGALNVAFGSLSWLPGLVVIWALNGVAQSSGWASMVKTLSRWFDPRQRGKLVALFTPCYVTGHAVSLALAGWVVTNLGWRNAFRLPALALWALAVAWFALVRDAPDSRPAATEGPALSHVGKGDAGRPASSVAPRGRPSLIGGGASMLALVRNPRLTWAFLVCFLTGMIKDGLTLWAPTYLVETQGLSVAQAAYSAVLMPVAGVGGTLLASWLLHRTAVRRELGPVLALAVLTAGALGIGLVQTSVHSSSGAGLVVALLSLTLATLGTQGIGAMMTTSLPLSMGREGKAALLAGSLDFTWYLGSGLSAVVVGALQDRAGWWVPLGCGVVVALAIAVVAFHEGHGSRAVDERRGTQGV